MAARNLTRVENWPGRLADFVAERWAMPFAWGQNDCAMFAADWVLTCTGHDPASAWRGRYHDALTAARACASLEDAATSELGEPCSPALAQRGDVVLFDGGFGPTLGVCIGHMLIAPSRDGLTCAPMTAAAKAWRIG